MARRENPSPSEILAQRMAQIKRAYESRLRPRMSKAARAALERERKRQIRLATAEFKAAKPVVTVAPPMKKVKAIVRRIEPRPRVKAKRPPGRTPIPIGGIARIIYKTKPEARKPPPNSRIESPVSEKWEFFDRKTGEPVSPWDVPAGPEYDEDVSIFGDERMFADEDYTYADFETDWGEYDHQDTGYADENA